MAVIGKIISSGQTGTHRMRQYSMNVRKPVFVDNPAEPKMGGDRLAVFKWLEKVCRKNGGRPLVLNVAGPRESKEPGLEAATERYIENLISINQGDR